MGSWTSRTGVLPVGSPHRCCHAKGEQPWRWGGVFFPKERGSCWDSASISPVSWLWTTEKCCCSVRPSGSHTQTAPALHHQEMKAGEEERWREAFGRRRRRGGAEGTPAPPAARPRAVSYLCTCGGARNNELCHTQFSLPGMSSPFLWDLSGEII